MSPDIDRAAITHPRHSRQRIIWTATALLILLLLGATAIIWKASTELISPARRALQDYHHEWMEKSAAHGITIQRFAALDGQVPCLLALGAALLTFCLMRHRRMAS